MSAAILCCSLCIGGTDLKDVLHLKDGSLVRGTIVEMTPDSTVRIRMSDGSVRTYSMAVVENITLEPGLPGTNATQPGDIDTAAFSVVYYGAISIPTEDFGATSGSEAGSAETGFGLGADVRYAFSPSYGWMGSLAFAFNGMVQNAPVRSDEIRTSTDSWIFLYFLNGLTATGNISPGFDVFLFGQVGLFRGTVPRIIILSGDTYATRQKASFASLAYSYGVGLTIHHFELSVRYLAGEPEYDITVSEVGGITTMKYRQPVTSVFITGGYRF
jgi:hypothetical protein